MRTKKLAHRISMTLAALAVLALISSFVVGILHGHGDTTTAILFYASLLGFIACGITDTIAHKQEAKK